MAQISARVPEDLVRGLDDAAAMLGTSRAELVRRALERYVEDFEDIAAVQERLSDPTDPILDWEDVKRELFGSD